MKYLVDNFKPAKLPILFRFEIKINKKKTLSENINFSVFNQCGKIIIF